MKLMGRFRFAVVAIVRELGKEVHGEQEREIGIARGDGVNSYETRSV